jgi:hypothetical protein
MLFGIPNSKGASQESKLCFLKQSAPCADNPEVGPRV